MTITPPRCQKPICPLSVGMWGLLLWVGVLFPKSLSACDDWFSSATLVESVSDCTPGQSSCLPLSYALALNYELSIDGDAISNAALNPCGFDSLFFISFGNLPGQGSAGPYTLLNWSINGQVYQGEFADLADLLDSLNTWDPIGDWTLDLSNQQFVGGASNNTYSNLQVEQNNTGIITFLSITATLLPQGTSVNLPFGEYWVTLSDGMGCIDSLLVRRVCLTTSSRVDTVVVGTTDTLCLPIGELLGNPVEVYNNCPGNSAAVADWEVLLLPDCIAVTGLAEGLGLGCLVLCDEYGLCDTTLVTLNVLAASTIGPIAVDDAFNLPSGLNFVGSLLENDLLRGSVETFSLVQLPVAGTASLNSDGTLLYTPDPEFCGTDSLSYQICNPWACDTAWVRLDVNCGDLLVYDGFSPNGDGVNETFFIESVDRFPNSQLQVFNRDGILVFEAQGYQNDWDGTWQDKDLPAGTYYYVLRLGEGRRQSGSIQLQR
jgi:gliding motility-associated-like protein